MDVGPPTGVPDEQSTPQREYRCSFCGKLQDQVERLVAGPNRVYICNESVVLCNETIAQHTTMPDDATIR